MSEEYIIFKNEGVLAASSTLKSIVDKVKTGTAVLPVELKVYTKSSAPENNIILAQLPQHSTIQSFTESRDVTLSSYSENLEVLIETNNFDTGVSRIISIPISDSHLVTPFSKGHMLQIEVDFYLSEDLTLYCKCVVMRGRELCIRTVETLVQLDLLLLHLNKLTRLEAVYLNLFNNRIMYNLAQGTKRFEFVSAFHEGVMSIKYLIPADISSNLSLLDSYLKIKDSDPGRALGMTLLVNSSMVAITQQVARALSYIKVGVSNESSD